MKDHDERLWKGKDTERGSACVFNRCAYLWWEWRLIRFMQMNVAGIYWWISNSKALRSKPMFNLTITKVTPSRTPWQSNTSSTLYLKKMPWKHLFVLQHWPAWGGKPTCGPTYQKDKAHTFFFSGGINYFSDTRSASFQKKHSLPWG